MNKQQLVTRQQAIKLKQLGFHDKTCAFAHENAPDLGISFGFPRDYNKKFFTDVLTNKKERPYISVPTVYEAFNWLIKQIKGHYFEIAWLEEQLDDLRIKSIAKNKYVRYRKAIDILIKAYEKDQNQHS